MSLWYTRDEIRKMLAHCQMEHPTEDHFALVAWTAEISGFEYKGEFV